MIQELIVVEGKNDVKAVGKAVEAEFIITHGYTLPPSVVDQIRRAQRMRGVIILTDPDSAGEQIRRKINRLVPGCKHAFIAREDASSENDIGVEQASVETIRMALALVRTEQSETRQEFTMADMVSHGLVGQGGASHKRNHLGKNLGIGFTNAKQFLRRLNVYGVSRLEFEDALREVYRETEQHSNWQEVRS